MMSDDDLSLLASTAAQWGFPLSAAQCAQFATYAAELQQWNRRTNLTSKSDMQSIVVRHLLDSLRCALAWGSAPATLVDVGSGAGFPGLPLKLLHPALHLTLIEATGKKAAFLEHICRTLHLEGVTIVTQRAEATGHDPQQRERHDVATARAVAVLRVLAEYCLPLVRVGGRVLLPKGATIAQELAEAQHALQVLGGTVAAVEPVALPGLEPRTLVVIAKTHPTPPRYPRAVGVPTRRPL
jgi:16S rRNA (guanine527-N7)-methyltransferase